MIRWRGVSWPKRCTPLALRDGRIVVRSVNEGWFHWRVKRLKWSLIDRWRAPIGHRD